MGAKRRWFVVLALIMLLVVQAKTQGEPGEEDTGENVFAKRMTAELSEVFGRMLYRYYMPALSFVEEWKDDTPWLLREQIDCLLPFYGYAQARAQKNQKAGAVSVREILLEEAREETAPDLVTVPEATSDAGAAPEELMRAENEAAMEMRKREALLSGTVFVPHVQQAEVDMEALREYETLVQEFYTVDSNTMIGSNQLDAQRFMEKDMTLESGGGGPQILIFHTHSQEAFADSVPGETATSIVGVGDRLAEVLTSQYGYRVLHHVAEYDAETRDDAYSRALPGVEEVLREYPDIQVVIDLHRDSMPEETRLVMDVDGRPTARFMFFNGLSRTRKTGNIAYLYNENLEDNLAFSFQMQKKAYEYYPGLTRKIYLKGYRYNMHLKPKYLLVELGAQNNTVEEAMNACDPLAHLLHMVLSGQ